MDAFLVILKNVAIFVALAIPGFLLVKTKILKATDSVGLSKLLTYVGMPFLILSGTLNIPFNFDTLKALLVCIGLGILFIVVQFCVTYPLTAMEKENKKRGMMRFCSAFANNGFLGLPLVRAVFGETSTVFTYAVLLNILSNIFMCTLGVYLISGDKNDIKIKKALFSPVLIAFIIGIPLNLLNIKTHVPEIGTFISHFGNLVTPVSMTILGMKMAEVSFKMILGVWKMYYVALLKLVVFPLICVLPLLLLPIGDNLILAIFIAFAMPTAGLASTFADQKNGDTKGAIAFTMGTTILSILTIPLLYALLVNIL